MGGIWENTAPGPDRPALIFIAMVRIVHKNCPHFWPTLSTRQQNLQPWIRSKGVFIERWSLFRCLFDCQIRKRFQSAALFRDRSSTKGNLLVHHQFLIPKFVLYSTDTDKQHENAKLTMIFSPTFTYMQREQSHVFMTVF